MNGRTPAEDRALLDRAATLRRVKITLNEEEIWLLYRLLVAERSGYRTPLPLGLAPEMEFAVGTALAKLSDATVTLSGATGSDA